MFSKPLLLRLWCSFFRFILEDWRKETWVKQVMKKIKLFFFYTTTPCTINIFLALWNQPNASKSQWNMICNQFHDDWMVVQREIYYWTIIMDLEWTTFVNTLCGTHHKKALTKVKYVQANIKKDWFWDICANFVHMVELVLVALKAFNGKQLIMGRAWFV